MSIPTASVNTSIDTFQTWISKTNDMATTLSNWAVTTAATSNGGSTTGNAHIAGIFSAANLVATTSLRGGSITSSGNLNIISNTHVVASNMTVTTNNFTLASDVAGTISVSSLAIGGNTVTISANVNVKNNSLVVNSAGRVSINTTSADAALTVAGTANVSGNTNIQGYANVGNTFNALGDVTFGSLLTVNGAVTFSNTLTITGQTNVAANVNVTGAAVFSNTVSVTGSLTVTGPINGTVNGTANGCARQINNGDYIAGGNTLTSDLTISVLASSTGSNNVVARDANGNFTANVVTANVVGNANTSSYLSYNSGFRSATDAATINTIVARDGNASFSANVITGTATAARYADLAEKYLADAEYPVGTVMIVGGVNEITASSKGTLALGVVSDKPAYLMNKDLEGGTTIALKGRVPIRTIGPVTKGEGLVADNNGLASQSSPLAPGVFAIALETNVDFGEKIVEGVVL